jgi:hypothetical protein
MRMWQVIFQTRLLVYDGVCICESCVSCSPVSRRPSIFNVVSLFGHQQCIYVWSATVYLCLVAREDPGYNRSSASPCVS